VAAGSALAVGDAVGTPATGGVGKNAQEITRMKLRASASHARAMFPPGAFGTVFEA
jgi:hypothetical protein